MDRGFAATAARPTAKRPVRRYNGSFNASLRDELRNGEIFFRLSEAKEPIKAWLRRYTSTRRAGTWATDPAQEAVISPSHQSKIPDHPIVAAHTSQSSRERRAKALPTDPASLFCIFMRNSELNCLSMIKTVANPLRLTILELLKDPVAHFPPQVDGDLVVDGVCADFLREKLGISAATASRHLSLLVDAGLTVATRKKGWTFYRRDEDAISRFTDLLQATL